MPSHNPTFVERNFTENEVSYCQKQSSPASSFAARWAGKEAVFKALGVKSKGAAAAMKDIEILNDPETGAPTVVLHGDAKAKAEEKGVSKVLISLSHSEVRRLIHPLFDLDLPLSLDCRYRVCSGLEGRIDVCYHHTYLYHLVLAAIRHFSLGLVTYPLHL